MNATTDDYERITDESPAEGELWAIHDPPRDTAATAVFGVVETLGHTASTDPTLDHESGERHAVEYKWMRTRDDWEGDRAMRVDETRLVLRLPEQPDEFDAEYASALDYITGYLTPEEILDVLNGEDLQAAGREGFEGLRMWILEGISDGITEYSVGHGHGPSRYASAVEGRLDELPEWAVDDVLYSEKERWSPYMDQGDSAGHVIEILELREAHLEEDHSEEIIDLVDEFDLDYDVDYRRDEVDDERT